MCNFFSIIHPIYPILLEGVCARGVFILWFQKERQKKLESACRDLEHASYMSKFVDGMIRKSKSNVVCLCRYSENGPVEGEWLLKIARENR